jgi:hypothetical protein
VIRARRAAGFPRIPAGRLLPLIDAWLANGGTIRELAWRAGLNERSVGGIVRGERETVTFGVADKLITHALGGPLIWHLSAEDGGQADLYRCPAEVDREGVDVASPTAYASPIQTTAPATQERPGAWHRGGKS